MRSILSLSTVYALAATSVVRASGISLSNFTPRTGHLSSDCEAVYTRTIQGCVATDFTPQKPGDHCSSGCVQGLSQIQKQIGQSCANDHVDKDSIIGVFLLGEGIQALCPGVDVTTKAPSSTQALPQYSAGSQRPSSAQASSTASASSASSTTASSSQAQQTTLATQPTNNSQQPPPAASSSSAKPASTPNGQKSNPASGGGSPFDVQATGSSSTICTLGTAAMAGILGTAVFFSTFL